MKKAKKTDIIIICVLAALLLAAAASALLPAIREEAAVAKVESYEYFNGKKIGILTGTNMEQESFKYFPDSEYFYFDGISWMGQGFAHQIFVVFQNEHPDIRLIPKNMNADVEKMYRHVTA